MVRPRKTAAASSPAAASKTESRNGVTPKRAAAVTTPKSKPRRRKKNEDVSSDSSDVGDSNEAGEIAGKKVFTFRTPKRKNQMSAKAARSAEMCQLLDKRKRREEKKWESAVTPKSTKVASNGSPLRGSGFPERTPYSLRRKIKSRLTKMAEEDGRGSCDDSSSWDEDSDLQSEGEEASPVANGDCGQRRSCRSTTMKAQAEKYFASRDEEGKTSDRTLAKLNLPKLDRQSLGQILSRMPRSHADEIERLSRSYEEQFSKWIFQLGQGFNLILYGLGSKFSLLRKFKEKLTEENSVLEVNGFFPGLTIKSILQTIERDILEREDEDRVVTRQDVQVRFIHQALTDREEHLYLVVHNLDGAALRNEVAQNLLCLLAGHERVHLVASVDHINAPLLWDQSKMSQLRWLWQDATTLEPYLRETSYENSLLVERSGSLALSALRHVFHSLTPNARGIFLLLVRHQLERGDAKNYAGMAFHDCYRRCREAFLVNSELTLKAQLTEFKDHVLLKTKKGNDGGEYLLIPLDSNTMEEFLAQQDEQP